MKTQAVRYATAILFMAGVATHTLPSHALAAMAQENTETAQPAETTLLEIQPAQVPLTSPLITQFLESYPELIKLSETLRAIKNPSASSQENESDIEEDPIYTLGNYLDDPEAADQINAVLGKYNFESFAEWANVAHSVALAAEASEMDSGVEDIEGQKKEAIQNLQADDTLTPDEKKAALAELEQQFAALAEFIPLPGNTQAVRPFLDKIHALGNAAD